LFLQPIPKRRANPKQQINPQRITCLPVLCSSGSNVFKRLTIRNSEGQY
jgi:hypothetical protein